MQRRNESHKFDKKVSDASVSVSELKFGRVKVKRHFCSERDLLSRANNHKREQLFGLGFELDLELRVFRERFVFKLKVIKFKGNFLDISVFIHFVLIKENHPARVIVSLDSNIDLLAFNLSFFHLGRLFVRQLSQLFQAVLLNNVILNFSRKSVVTIAFLIYFQHHDSFFIWKNLHCELIF
jgi:hypothetical protein